MEMLKEKQNNGPVDQVHTSDTPYTGLFIRDQVGESSSQAGSGAWTNSPDIFCNGVNPLSAPSELTTTANYNAGLPSHNSETPHQTNYVYVRGKNINAPQANSTIYLYYADAALNILPQHWQTSGIQYNGQSTNAASISVGSNGDLVATTTPSFLWTPPSSHHYCLAVWVKNGTDQSTAPALPTLNNWSELGSFILSHPEIAWRNLQQLAAVDGVYHRTLSIGNPPNGGDVSIGLSFENVPANGTWEFTVPLSNTNNFHRSGTTLSDQNYSVTFPVQLPSDWNTSITFSYTPPANTPMPSDASIEPLVTMSVEGEMLALAKKRVPYRLIKREASEGNAIHYEMVVGSIRCDLTG